MTRVHLLSLIPAILAIGFMQLISDEKDVVCRKLTVTDDEGAPRLSLSVSEDGPEIHFCFGDAKKDILVRATSSEQLVCQFADETTVVLGHKDGRRGIHIVSAGETGMTLSDSRGRNSVELSAGKRDCSLAIQRRTGKDDSHISGGIVMLSGRENTFMAVQGPGGTERCLLGVSSKTNSAQIRVRQPDKGAWAALEAREDAVVCGTAWEDERPKTRHGYVTAQILDTGKMTTSMWADSPMEGSEDGPGKAGFWVNEKESMMAISDGAAKMRVQAVSGHQNAGVFLFGEANRILGGLVRMKETGGWLVGQSGGASASLVACRDHLKMRVRDEGDIDRVLFEMSKGERMKMVTKNADGEETKLGKD